MSGVHVKRAATPQEREALQALRVRVFVQEQRAPLDEEFDEYDDSAVQVVALLYGRVVGTGRMYRAASGDTQIGRMAVEPGHRRVGTGGLILAFLEEQARDAGVARVVLHAQTYVQCFYARHGYVAEGKPFFEAGIEHILMAKELVS